LKTQLAVNKITTEIICLDHEKGRRHDSRLLEESKTRLHPKTKALVDLGYLGLQNSHANTEMPKKSSKKNPLTKEDKAKNRTLSSRRVLCENVIGAIKRFRILADRYRNRRKRFKLRFSLIAAFYNHGLLV